MKARQRRAHKKYLHDDYQANMLMNSPLKFVCNELVRETVIRSHDAYKKSAEICQALQGGLQGGLRPPAQDRCSMLRDSNAICK